MADPISTCSTVWHIAKRLYEAYEKVQEMRHAAESINKLAAQLTLLRDELKWVKDQFDAALAGDEVCDQFKRLYVKDDPTDKQKWKPGPLYKESWSRGPLLIEIEKLLQELQDKLQPLESKVQKAVEEDTKRRNTFKASLQRRWRHFEQHKRVRQIKFPFQREDIEKDIKELKAMRSEIEAVKSSATFDVLHNDHKESRYHQILEWLSPLSFHDAQKDHTEKSLGPTMDSGWLFEDQAFEAWRKGPCEPFPERLFLYGQGGSGKTKLASQIVAHLEEKYRSDEGVAILYMYLRYDEQSAQTLQALLGSLLKQIVMHYGLDHIPPEIQRIHATEREKGSTHASTDAVLGQLREEFSKLHHVFIIIDGLDEVHNTLRKQLIKYTSDLRPAHNKGLARKVSLLYTSRRLDRQPSRMKVKCDGIVGGGPCRNVDLKIYYTCKVHQSHGRDFHYCSDCALDANDCQTLQHQLQPPAERVEIDLRTPDEYIERYVLSLMKRETSLGENASASSRFQDTAAMDGDVFANADETTYLGRLFKDDKEKCMEVAKVIAEASDGLVLLAHAQWEHLKEADDFEELDEALDSLPRELDESFEGTMKRVIESASTDAKAEQARHMITWVSQAQRVLTWKDLQYAMSIRLSTSSQQTGRGNRGARDLEEFNTRALKDPPTLMAASRGLLFISTDDCVRLTHRTAYEHFRKPSVVNEHFGDAQEHMAAVCLKALTYADFKEPCKGDDEADQIETRLRKFPFAAYAAQYWGFHAQLSQSSPQVSSLLQQLVTLQGNLLSAVQISAHTEDVYKTGWTERKNVNAIHVAAWFGLETMFGFLKGKGYSIDEEDRTKHHRTPLLWSCRGGRGEAVKKLIDLGANVNAIDGQGLIPLTQAAYLGKGDAVKELCHNENVDVNVRGPKAGRTPLMLAASGDHGSAVEALSTNENLDVNLQDAEGYTALALAARLGALEAVKSLLEIEGIDIERPTKVGSTPLHLAAEGGHQKIVHELLNEGANAQARDANGAIPLRNAVDNGHLAVVEEFKLENLLHDNATENDLGKSLLFAAAGYGHHSLVQGLIDHGFNVDAQANDGSTALHDAARMGKVEVVKVLLRNQIKTDIKDTHGKTAADVAFESSNFDIATLIRGRPILHDEDTLPATSLARLGRSEILKARAAKSDHDLLKPDGAGDTPLTIAIRYRKFDAARIILEACAKEEVAIDRPGTYDRTSLHEAAPSFETGLVQLLLAHRPAPNVNCIDKSGNTPLSLAIKAPDFEAAVDLIASGAEIAKDDLPPSEILEAAIKANNFVAIRNLVFAGASIDYTHEKLAKEGGDARIMRLLKNNRTFVRGDVEPEGSRASLEDHIEEECDDEDENIVVISPSLNQSRGPDMTKPAFRTRDTAILA